MKLPRGIRLRGGRFFVDVTVKGAGRKTTTVDTLDEAKAAQAAFRLALSRGDDTMPTLTPTKKGWTIEQAIEKTLRMPAPDGWRGAKSERNLTLMAAKVAERFGKTRPIHSVLRADVDEWVEGMQDAGKANATINRRLAALSKLVSVTVEAGAWPGAPLKMPSRLDEGEGRIRFLTADEEKALLACFHTWGLTETHDAVCVLVDTGLRMGELFRLTAQDVDLKGRTLSVWVSKGGAPRTIPLTDRVRAILEPRVARGGTLFTEGYWSLRGDWERARTHLGKRDDDHFVVYVCRHTFCSRLAQRGVQLVHIKTLAGHANLTTTLRYAHLSNADLTAAIKVLEPAP